MISQIKDRNCRHQLCKMNNYRKYVTLLMGCHWILIAFRIELFACDIFLKIFLIKVLLFNIQNFCITSESVLLFYWNVIQLCVKITAIISAKQWLEFNRIGVFVSSGSGTFLSLRSPLIKPFLSKIKLRSLVRLSIFDFFWSGELQRLSALLH